MIIQHKFNYGNKLVFVFIKPVITAITSIFRLNFFDVGNTSTLYPSGSI